MNDFDFLLDHGFGVVYGEKAVRQKIIELGHLEPRKGNNMNEITTDTAVTEAGVAEATTVALVFNPVTGVFETAPEEVAVTTGEGEVGSVADVTVH